MARLYSWNCSNVFLALTGAQGVRICAVFLSSKSPQAVLKQLKKTFFKQSSSSLKVAVFSSSALISLLLIRSIAFGVRFSKPKVLCLFLFELVELLESSFGWLEHFYPKICIHCNLCFCWVSYNLFIYQSSADPVSSIYLTPGCEMHARIGGACAILGRTCTNIFTFLPQIVMRHN